MGNLSRLAAALVITVSMAIGSTPQAALASPDAVIAAASMAATKIVAQPKPVYVVKGKAAVFAVKAQGRALKYQWQSRKPGAKWFNIPGATSRTYKIKTSRLASNKMSFRVKVKGTARTVTSRSAVLYVEQPLKLSAQPKSLRAVEGQVAVFAVAAKGTGLKYQWQRKAPSSARWVNIRGASASTYRIKPIELTSNKTAFRVKVMSRAQAATSRPAVLSVGRAAVPVVRSVSPKRLLAGRAATVTLTGLNMDHLSEVKYGNQSVRFSVVDASRVKVAIPNPATGDQALAVFTKAGRSYASITGFYYQSAFFNAMLLDWLDRDARRYGVPSGPAYPYYRDAVAYLSGSRVASDVADIHMLIADEAFGYNQDLAVVARSDVRLGQIHSQMESLASRGMYNSGYAQQLAAEAAVVSGEAEAAQASAANRLRKMADLKKTLP